MQKVIDHVLQHISQEAGKEQTIQDEALDPSRFKPVESNDKTVAFIDGGNAELLNGNTFSLQFIRVACVILGGSKRVLRSEFYLFTSIGEDMVFHSQAFPVNGDILLDTGHLDISLDDKTVSNGVREPTASVIGSVARRFSELALASSVQDDVDVVVLDGNLEKTFTNEDVYVERLGSNVCGLAKTSTMMTQQGGNVAALLSKQPGVWNYPVSVVEGVRTSFVRLNSHSKYVFMLQSRGQEDGSSLVSHSKDPLFLGYPYGLLFADQVARVSNQERILLLTTLQAKFKDNYAQVEGYLNTSSAHDILDRIS